MGKNDKTRTEIAHVVSWTAQELAKYLQWLNQRKTIRLKQLTTAEPLISLAFIKHKTSLTCLREPHDATQ